MRQWITVQQPTRYLVNCHRNSGRRTKLTWPGGGLFVDTDYLVTGEVTKIRENGATSGVGVLATYAYDDLGRRTGLTFGNGATQSYGYDPVSRLASHANDLAGTANDLSQTFARNPASQIASQVRTGDAYAWTGHFNQNVAGAANGLNQLTSVGPKTLSHDSKGNVTAFGTRSFTYSSENLLVTGPGSTTLAYDPVMRLQQVVSGGATARFAYDGLDRIAEYDGFNALLRRYVHGPGADDPIVWYEGSGTGDRRFLGSDERGSIVSVTDSSGTALGLNKYDEYGMPQAGNLGAFGYTGQAWLSTISVYYYKARAYDPELGRFLQTDPIGYADSPNLYAYVLNDPVNLTDPLGMIRMCGGGPAGLPVPMGPCPGMDGINPAVATGALFTNVNYSDSNRRVDSKADGPADKDEKGKEKDKERKCNDLQRYFEELGDTAGRVSVVTFDMALYGEIGGQGMARFGSGQVAKFGRFVAGKYAAGFIGAMSVTSGLISLGAYGVSGQSKKAIYNFGVTKVIEHTLGKFPGPAGKKAS